MDRVRKLLNQLQINAFAHLLEMFFIDGMPFYVNKTIVLVDHLIRGGGGSQHAHLAPCAPRNVLNCDPHTTAPPHQLFLRSLNNSEKY
jgi:hypothetical protein